MKKDYFFEGYRMVEFYDDYLGGHTDDFDFWIEVLRPYQSVLEIACGTGRITIPLLLNGKDVTAVDYSPEMLEKLEIKTRDRKLSDHLTIIQADMRNLHLNRTFDAVIITANSVNHLEKNKDLEKTLKCMYCLLKENGILVFDALNPELHHLLRDREHYYDHAEFVYNKTGERITVCENSDYDRATQTSAVSYYYSRENGETIVLNIKNRFYFPCELNYVIEKSGFKIIEKFGTYKKTPFEKNAKEQIFILKK